MGSLLDLVSNGPLLANLLNPNKQTCSKSLTPAVLVNWPLEMDQSFWE